MAYGQCRQASKPLKSSDSHHLEFEVPRSLINKPRITFSLPLFKNSLSDNQFNLIMDSKTKTSSSSSDANPKPNKIPKTMLAQRKNKEAQVAAEAIALKLEEDRLYAVAATKLERERKVKEMRKRADDRIKALEARLEEQDKTKQPDFVDGHEPQPSPPPTEEAAGPPAGNNQGE